MKTLGLIIVAAGSSQRFREHPESPSSQTKILIRWKDHAMIVHTLRAMRVLNPSETVVVFRQEDEKMIKEEIENGGFDLDKIKFVLGGQTRQESVYNGLQALGDCELVAVHDGARPFVSKEFLKGLRQLVEEVSAVIPVLPVTETLKELDENGQIIKTFDRSRLARAQTPQVFPKANLLKLHERYKDENPAFTDDAMLFEKESIPVMAVEGEATNIKVTVPGDLELAGVLRA